MLISVINIPDKLLNKVQVIINTFIWNRATPTLKLAITEQALLNGGVTILNVKKYYNATYLAACIDWWKMSSEDINWTLEQNSTGMNFVKWMVEDHCQLQALWATNDMAKILGKIWVKKKINPIRFNLTN